MEISRDLTTEGYQSSLHLENAIIIRSFYHTIKKTLYTYQNRERWNFKLRRNKQFSKSYYYNWSATSFSNLGKKSNCAKLESPSEKVLLIFMTNHLCIFLEKKALKIYANISTNNLHMLTILTVNHLTLTDFEGFPVSRNCSGKTIEGTKKFHAVWYLQWVLEIRTFLLFTEEYQRK